MNPVQNPNGQQRPNLSKQALDQQLEKILANLDHFIQRKENNQLGPEETKMVRVSRVSDCPPKSLFLTGIVRCVA